MSTPRRALLREARSPISRAVDGAFSPTRRSAPRRRAGPGGGLRPVPAAPPASPARRTARGRGGRPVASPNVVTSLARESFAQNCARISWAGCSHRRVPQPIGGKLGAKGAPRTPPTTLEAAPPSSPRSGGAAPTHGPVVGLAARPPRAPGGLYKASRPLRWSRGRPEVPAAPGRYRVPNFIRRPGRAGDLRPVVRPGRTARPNPPFPRLCVTAEGPWR